MKFGKRLAAEAARRWLDHYLDYKEQKRAIQDDIAAGDPEGLHFQAAMQAQLEKINTFYEAKETQLEDMLRNQSSPGARALTAFRADCADLRKYAVLNYIAVIKSCKKRNRQLAEGLASTPVPPIRAIELLSQQYFFTSPKLAALTTEAEIITKEETRAAGEELLEDYQCPICFEVLHNPVVLTCAHRFCWGCLIAHCATSAGTAVPLPLGPQGGADKASKLHTAGMIATESGESAVSTYDCPVCRKAQILDLDRLQVDPHLTRYIHELRLRDGHAEPMKGVEVLPAADAVAADDRQPASAEALNGVSSRQASQRGQLKLTAVKGVLHNELPSPLPSPRSVVEGEDLADDGQPFLLRPQQPEHKGHLTVVLDLDGTLVSSYTPARAPRLPAGMDTYIVGRGARMNPNGVFVVERPGLSHFFQQLSSFAEVVLFTAGVEDYAAPIADRLQLKYNCFAGRLYRPATVACSLYPCIKDLSLLGRDLARTVLVDDTPLAFCRQPDNGIPVFNFRGDSDDRLLGEAVLPLLQSLAAVPDVRPKLNARFNMPHWFKAQGVALPLKTTRRAVRAPHGTSAILVRHSPAAPRAPSSDRQPSLDRAGRQPLLLLDFDKTLTDCDAAPKARQYAGERLVGALAPELCPMLAALEMPANFVPTTNAVLGEMQRRGISRDAILAELRRMGSEIPQPSMDLLQWAMAGGHDVRILSDCNSVFISQMLAGAGLSACINEVITNSASFQRIAGVQEGDNPAAMLQPVGAMAAAAHRLVIEPRVDDSASHDCQLCPANLCKGQEVQALRQKPGFGRIVYCGDGANDLCPALMLGLDDYVLARQGHALDRLLAQHATKGQDGVAAHVLLWRNHDELRDAVQNIFKS